MTMTPGTQVRAIAEAAEHQARFLPPTRYRHPGDVIRLITAVLVLAGALAVTITTHATYAGVSAAAVTALAPAALAGRVLAGLVQAVLVTAAAAAVVVTLRYRRFRLLVGLTGVGLANGPAVSAVVLYRLATYWLPVAPGWLCWRVLQRRDYV
jgi:glycosyltransferase 2 family protein